jgi:hypothetical protein
MMTTKFVVVMGTLLAVWVSVCVVLGAVDLVKGAVGSEGD